MNFKISKTQKPSVGIIGFGAFGKLIARHTAGYFDVCAYDPSPCPDDEAAALGVALTSLEAAARCDVIVVATPVSCME